MEASHENCWESINLSYTLLQIDNYLGASGHQFTWRLSNVGFMNLTQILIKINECNLLYKHQIITKLN